MAARRPIYRKTAAFGHFGRTEETFTWEATDKARSLNPTHWRGALSRVRFFIDKRACPGFPCCQNPGAAKAGVYLFRWLLLKVTKHSLEITVPETEVDQETGRAAAAIQVQCFRPGKAPAMHGEDPLCRRHPPGSARKAGSRNSLKPLNTITRRVRRAAPVEFEVAPSRVRRVSGPDRYTTNPSLR